MYRRNLDALTQTALRAGRRVISELTPALAASSRPPPGAGDWLAGIVLGPAGFRRYHLYRPPGLKLAVGERIPLMVMLHGCGQSGRDFAASTRMNRLAGGAGFFVLYPEQDRLAHPQGCWQWYERRSGKADAEAATLMAALDQVSLLYPIDRDRVAVAGLSAGAGMAALMAMRYASRFQAVAMHSGVAPDAGHSTASALSAMRGKHLPSVAMGNALNAPGAVLPPLMVLQGDADSIVAPTNAENAATAWASAIGARPGPERLLQRGKRHLMRITDYSRAGRVAVRLCRISALGHAWSGGAPDAPFSDAAGPDASRLIWAFAVRQFKTGGRLASSPLAARRDPLA